MSVLDSLPAWAREPGMALTTPEAVTLTRLSSSRLSALARSGRVRRTFVLRKAPLWCREDLAAYVEGHREGATNG